MPNVWQLLIVRSMALAELEVASNSARIRLSGHWSIHATLPTFHTLKIPETVHTVELVGEHLETWDSSLIHFIHQCQQFCAKNQMKCQTHSLPHGAVVLSTVQSRNDNALETFFERPLIVECVQFLGHLICTLKDACRGALPMRLRDFVAQFLEVGVHSLPIVALINFLIGLIMAFIGAVQLSQFGANVYVANLVAIAMAREMGAMMTAVILSGRVGASFAASIGSMKINDELDAFTVTGIQPMGFLILPRIVAFTLAMLPLCVFADFFGILGGACVTISLFDVSLTEYIQQTRTAVSIASFNLGLFKSVVFGFIVACWGCFFGLRCAKNANAVGGAATRAVVYAITSLIVADALFAVLCNLFKI